MPIECCVVKTAQGEAIGDHRLPPRVSVGQNVRRIE
jgi:hypothetical protein